MIKLTINGKAQEVDVDPDTPLLWVIREWVGLTGTKYGCGIAQCGACTVHVDGVATRSCSIPVSAVAGTRSPRSKVSPKAERRTRCKKPGSRSMSRSAATARAE